MFGLFNALYINKENEKKAKYICFTIFSSLFFGIVIQKIGTFLLYDMETINILRTFLLFCIVLFLTMIKFTKSKFIFHLVTASLFLYVGADFINDIKDLNISSTSVINTEAILNIASILLALILSIYYSVAITNYANALKNKKLFYAIFSFSLFIFILDLITKIMLLLLKKDLMELTSLRLSFVAKITYYEFYFIYFYALSMLIFVLAYNANKNKIDNSLDSPLKRKLKKVILTENRWIKSSLLSAFVLTSFLLYYDLYSSQPLKISTPIMLKPNAQDNFVIELKDVLDGDLHRYAYITSDGRKIRFFLINRYPKREKVVAVFDACMICGDMGYIKKDNQVICIACDVRIFIPSIGKAGGCNPIPFKFTKKDGKMIIHKSEIVAGATYFSEVVELNVIDPISGVKLVNTKAPFNYEYLGKTFYFESEANMDTFKNDPEKFADVKIKRKWRIEGNDKANGENK